MNLHFHFFSFLFSSICLFVFDLFSSFDVTDADAKPFNKKIKMKQKKVIFSGFSLINTT